MKQTASKVMTVEFDIDDIEMVTEYDDMPDLSWIGEFSNVAGPGAIPVSRKHAHVTRCAWFNPGNYEANGDKYAKQDYKRLLAYYRDEWHMIGVYAQVSVEINGHETTRRSGGIWGVESDSGEDYLAEIYAEERDQLLRDMAEEFGFDYEQVKAEISE